MKPSIDEMTWKASQFAEKGNWLHAIQLYDKILDIDDTYMPAYHAVAEQYIARQQFDSARDYLLDAHDINPGDEKTIFLLGNIHLMQKDGSSSHPAFAMTSQKAALSRAVSTAV